MRAELRRRGTSVNVGGKNFGIFVKVLVTGI